MIPHKAMEHKLETTTTAERAALSLEEAYGYLGVARATLYRLLDSGSLKSFHIGRRRLVLKSELDRFIAQQVEAEDGRNS